MGIARRAAQEYAKNPKVAALAVAGSVGAGLADRFSDLELDCYWATTPSDDDRTRPIAAVNGTLTALWEFDDDDQEWSEDWRLGGLDVTVSNFLTVTVGQMLDDVTGRADAAPVKHMRLAAIQRSVPLHGAELIGTWRELAAYPDRLVAAMVERALGPGVLRGWAARDALASRGDDLALAGLLNRIGHAVAGTMLALNRVYQPHRMLKWQRHLLDGLAIAPERVGERIRELTAGQPGGALRAAEELLTETVALAEKHSAADLTAFREEMAERRLAIDPPGRAGETLSGAVSALKLCQFPRFALPAPFGPRNPVTFPERMVNDRSSTAVLPPYRLVRPSASIIGHSPR